MYTGSHTFLCRLLNPAPILVQPVRTRILYSYRGGKPRTVKAVVNRFFRLYNGLWIRTRAGRYKKRWLKPLRRVQRLKQHVFVNKTQCRMLDRMVNKYYKTPKYYVDDPYAPYHRKSNLPDYRYEPPKFYPWLSTMQHLFTVLKLSIRHVFGMKNWNKVILFCFRAFISIKKTSSAQKLVVLKWNIQCQSHLNITQINYTQNRLHIEVYPV